MNGLVQFARDQLGLELFVGQVEVLREWEASGKRKALLCLGRRSGKGLMSSVAAIHNATMPDYSQYLRPGEQRYVLVVATELGQAREFIRVTRELLDHAPDHDLAALVDRGASTQDEVVFRTGAVIRSMPCSARSVRGRAASLIVFDEAAHFVSDTDGFQAFRSVWRALVPSVAQFQAEGYVLVTSTPLWPSGPFYELFKAGERGADRDLFVIRRPTWEVNASINRESLEGEFQADPEGARVEFGAEFVQGLGAFLDATQVDACVSRGVKWVPVQPGLRYKAAIDPAFAAGGDAFTLAVAHLEDGTYVLDVIQGWRGQSGPLNSDWVLDEVAEMLRRYNLHEVTADQFAVQPITDALRRRGIQVDYQPLTAELKADIFTHLKRAINLRQAELLDDPQLIAELNRLEVRPSPSGKPRIRGASGFHDDRAMAVATAFYALGPGLGATAFGDQQLRALAAAYGVLDENDPSLPQVPVR